MKLPALTDPQRYVGLYAFDFGDWVSVGYTAPEIDLLLADKTHGSGQAFRIHRVDEQGRIELAGVSARDLTGDDIMLFACSDAEIAAEMFSQLRKLAAERQLPCSTQLNLVDIADLDPPHAVCMIFPRHARSPVATWLSETGFNGGDMAMGGPTILQTYHASNAIPIASCRLPGKMDCTVRSPDEVLGSVRRTLQR